jgi:hypothetical protein
VFLLIYIEVRRKYLDKAGSFFSLNNGTKIQVATWLKPDSLVVGFQPT